MSARPTEQKRRRKVAKAFRRTPLTAMIDPVQWLMDRRLAPTKKAARELVLAGRLKSESHTVGIGDGFVPEGDIVKEGKIVVPIAAAYRPTLRVAA